ncbi:MAG: hypothetical protein PHV17_04335 [Candidatus Omnitrophica bacterium]|nr:hypothetical protein [Candidatus Omnitrophota bacterium]
MEKKFYIPMEITRVKLNPEQAVLSCCDAAGKGEKFVTVQCDLAATDCAVTGDFDTASS